MPGATSLPNESALSRREGEECIYIEGDAFVHAIIRDISVTDESISAEICPRDSSGFRPPGATLQPWKIGTRREGAGVTSDEFHGGPYAPWSIYFGEGLVAAIVPIMAELEGHGWLWRKAALRALLPTPGIVSDGPWRGIQTRLDRCAVCLRETCFVPSLPGHSRPWSPSRKGRLLLVSEAPPESGGFWHVSQHKD